MSQMITGLHHVTAMASGSQSNVDFYTGILGLRLVKKTINFDAPDVYHFYYGNETGAPGTILTFFPFHSMPRGRKGKGQLTVTSFSISEGSMGYWLKRLRKFNVPFKEPQQRFDEAFIYFEDFDGLGLELVTDSSDPRPPFTYGAIPVEHAIKGFFGVTIEEEGYERTAGVLTGLLDHALVSEAGNRFRFSAGGEPGNFVDLVCSPDGLRGMGGSGTVHHLAFATPSDVTQQQARKKISAASLNVTPVLDRQYFHSIYFREPGGVLFEVATFPPGFEVDEEKAHLGETLKLPIWEEPNRTLIESGLTPIAVDVNKFKD